MKQIQFGYGSSLRQGLITFLTIFCLLNGPLESKAQKKGKAKIDSLRQEFNKSKDPLAKFNILKFMCNGFDFTGNYKAILDSSYELQRLANQLKDRNLLAEAYQERSNSFWRLSKYKEAKKANDSALLYLPEKKKPSQRLSGIYQEYNLIHLAMGNVDSSIYFGRKAVKIDSIIQSKERTNAINSLAISYMSKNDFVSANTYFFKALKLAQEIKDQVFEARCLINIGAVFLEMKNYKQAKYYTEKCYELRKKTENIQGLAAVLGNLGDISFRENDLKGAVEKFRESITYARRAQHLPNLLFAYGNISETFAKLNQQDSAFFYAREMVELCETKQARNQISSAYLRLGNRQSEVGDFQAARLSFQKSLDYANLYPTYSVKRFVVEKMAEVCEKLGDFSSALAFHKQYKLLEDSIFNENNSKSLAKLELDYQTEKKDKEIAQQKLDLSHQNLLILEKEKALAAQSFSLLLQKEATKKESAFNDLLQAKNQNAQLELENKERKLKQQELEALAQTSRLELEKRNQELENKQLRDELFRRNSIIGGGVFIFLIAGLVVNSIRLRKRLDMQNAILEQRKRLSADLHDDVGATLSSISIYTQAIKNKLKNNEPEQVMELVNKIGENSRETISTLGDIVWNLNPINDSAEKLFNRMESTATMLLSAQNTQLEFALDPSLKDLEFSLEAKQNLYLIFKETINNAAKYAQASLVKASFQKNGKHLEMSISDNGIGFDLSSKSEGNGLRNIRLRAEELKGVVQMNSSEQGTETMVKIPFSNIQKQTKSY